MNPFERGGGEKRRAVLEPRVPLKKRFGRFFRFFDEAQVMRIETPELSEPGLRLAEERTRTAEPEIELGDLETIPGPRELLKAGASARGFIGHDQVAGGRKA